MTPTTKPAHKSPSVQLASQRRSLVTHAQSQASRSLAALHDTVESDHVELAQEIATEAMAACRAYENARTPREMAEATRRIRANVKRQAELARMVG